MNAPRPTGIVSMPREVLHLLLELPGEADMETLRSVGDAGGASLLAAFAEWSAAADPTGPADMTVEAFARRAAHFLDWCGWGSASLRTSADTLIEVGIADCWETHRAPEAHSGCHLTTGLLHGFFAGLAGYELGVMELECAGLGGAGECRFVIGTPEMLDSIYAGLSAGASYDEIVAAAR
jgi:hypothetical protein